MTLSHRGFLLCSLVCAALASIPFLFGLPGSFVFDDLQNIVLNDGIQLHSLTVGAIADAAFSAQPGGMTRVLPTLTFALDFWRASGLDPATFKITNIAVHALTTFVLILLLNGLLQAAGATTARSPWFAIALALAWALHPLQVSSVLYIVQRMQTLSTLFVLLSLWTYLSARRAQMEGRRGRTGWMLSSLLWVVALSCKEDAALVPVYALAMELTVLRFRAHDADLSRGLRRGYMAIALLGSLVYLLVVIPHYWSSERLWFRDFSTPERLLSQGRILCMYLWEILIPLPSHMPFYYDWLEPSRGLLQPWTTIPALLLLLALLVTAWRVRHKRPLFSLGVLLFLSGHLVTANVVPLELAFEHRNHFPLIGVVLAAGDLLAWAADRFRVGTAMRALACIAVIAVLACLTCVRAHSWNSGLNLAVTSTRLAPNSARAWNTLCVLYFDLGGGQKRTNPNLDKAISACNEGAKVAKDSVTSQTNLVAYKAIQGSLGPDDWDQYLAQLRRVPMTPENTSTIWVILNKVRDGVPMDEARVLEAVDIVDTRAPFRPIESAAIGYFILGHTRQPDRAIPYFARAIRNTSDPAFGTGIMEDLRQEGRSDVVARLQAALAVRGDAAPAAARAPER